MAPLVELLASSSIMFGQMRAVGVPALVLAVAVAVLIVRGGRRL